MTTLPTGPDDALAISYGSGLSQKYLVRRVTFGDSYTQRALKGLNSKPQQWKLVWKSLTDANAETLRQFFEDLGGVSLLTWRPFGQSVDLKWTGDGFNSQPSKTGLTDCDVTLTQEFDL